MTLEQLGSDSRFMNAVQTTIASFPNKPFLCLPMSCCLLGYLERFCPEYNLAVKTGDLFFKDHLILKQNFDMNRLADEDIDIAWEGHAWLEVNDQFIVDLSIPRTILSDAFTSPYKDDVVAYLGTKCLIIDKDNNRNLLRHVERSVLSAPLVDAIINNALKTYFSQS